MKKREWKIEDGGWQARGVLECGRPLPLLIRDRATIALQSARGLAQSKTWRIFGALLTFFAITISAHAQPYSINWFKVAGGGGTSAGGAYQVSGTIGQHDAGGPMTGGNYSLAGGFWSVITVVQTPGAPLLSIALTSNSIVVSWPASAANYVLQQNSDLNTANWTPAGVQVTTNGVTLSVTISPTAGNLFFRLNSP